MSKNFRLWSFIEVISGEKSFPHIPFLLSEVQISEHFENLETFSIELKSFIISLSSLNSDGNVNQNWKQPEYNL